VYNAASVVITTCFSIIFAEAFVYFESVLSTDQKMSSLLFSFRAAAQQALTRRGAMAVNSPLFRRDYRQVIMEQDGKKTSVSFVLVMCRETLNFQEIFCYRSCSVNCQVGSLTLKFTLPSAVVLAWSSFC